MSKPWYVLAKNRMRERDFKYRELADYMHVSTGTVGHWLVGRRNVDIDTLKKIASFLDMPLAELCGEDPGWVSNPEERQWLEIYRAMPEDERAVALKMLSGKSPDSK